jgi:chromosome segregation ATPase
MMSLFLIAALGFARDQTFLKLGEVTSLKESSDLQPGSEAPGTKDQPDNVVDSVAEDGDEFKALVDDKEEADKKAKLKIDHIQDTAKDLTRLVDQQKPEFKFTKNFDQMKRVLGVPVPIKIKRNEDNLKHQIRSITTNLATLNGAMGTTGQLSASHSEVVKRYVTKIEDLQKKVKELSIKVTQHEEEKNKHLQEIAQTEASREAAIGQKGDAESEGQKSKQLIADLKNENSVLHEELRNKREEIEGIEQQQAFNNGSMNGLEENQKLIVNYYQDEIRKMEEKIGELNENKIVQEKKLEKMTEQVDSQSQEIESLKREQSDNQQLTTSFDHMVERRCGDTTSKLHQCEAKENNLQGEIYTKADVDHCECKKAAQLQRADAEKDLSGKENEIENLKSENKKLKGETQDQKEKLYEMIAYQTEQGKTLNFLEGEVAHAARISEENVQLQNKIKTQQLQIDGLNEDIAQSEFEVHAAKPADEGYGSHDSSFSE